MIKAIKNRIFIKKDERPDKIGLIYVPKVEDQHAPPYSGTIISIGSAVLDPDYKIGTKILFYDLCGTEFEINGEKILSIKEDEVLAIVENKNIEIM
jgi:chaperonin GroES